MAIKDEIQLNEIDKYVMLQRIKQASTDENPILDYEITVSRAKLEALGFNLESLTLVK